MFNRAQFNVSKSQMCAMLDFLEEAHMVVYKKINRNTNFFRRTWKLLVAELNNLDTGAPRTQAEWLEVSYKIMKKKKLI